MTDSIEFHYKALDETIQVVPFYFPGRADVWHERLGSGVLGNFWMEPVRIEFAGATHEFSCRLAFLLHHLLFFFRSFVGCILFVCGFCACARCSNLESLLVFSGSKQNEKRNNCVNVDST